MSAFDPSNRTFFSTLKNTFSDISMYNYTIYSLYPKQNLDKANYAFVLANGPCYQCY